MLIIILFMCMLSVEKICGQYVLYYEINELHFRIKFMTADYINPVVCCD